MTPKEIVKAFYESDLANDLNLVSRFYHKECKIIWNSSKGYTELDYNAVYKFFKGITESYNSLRFQTSHLLAEGNHVTSRHTLYACTIESPDDEIPLAHYISILEIKDQKIYRAFEISQPADMVTINSKSFSEIKN